MYKIKFNKILDTNKITNIFNKTIKKDYLIGGKEVSLFEKEFARYVGVNYCITVANGTDALEIALESLNLKKNTEVIIPANAWISAASAVIRANLKICFCDINLDNYSISIEDLKKRITKNTSAIIIVHMYGYISNIDEIVKIARSRNLKIIEDCAQAHGTKYRNKKAGTFGDMATFSFYPTKNLGCFGDGGAILTSKKIYKQRCLRIRHHGALTKYDHTILGRNSKLDTIQAAILRHKLLKLEKNNKKRNFYAKFYFKNFQNIAEIITPKVYPESFYSFHQFVVRVKNRDKLMKFLNSKGIETIIHYPKLLCDLKIFKKLNCTKMPLKASKNLGKKILSLPISEGHSLKDIKYICHAVKKFFKKN